MKSIVALFSLITLSTAAVANPIDRILGKWRGEFQLRPGVLVPFNFEVANKAKTTVVYFVNADERFEGGTIRQNKDSVFIALDQFDNELAFKIDGTVLSGVLRKQDGSGVPTPVSASKNVDYRFASAGVSTPPVADISGTYDITFTSPNGTTEKSVGLFTQQGNKLKGTFLRITGDSRFLEGTVEGDEFRLSSFIGSSPAYFKGKISADGKLSGESIGSRSSVPFTGVPDENAALPDASKLTFLKDGYTTLDFSFPDVNGNMVSLKDARFKDKVVLITITGTWCPNCMDEANFLVPWYNKNKNRGVEIVALQYERQTDTAFARKALTRFREKYGVEYVQLFAGKADKQVVAASLPALNTFLSFPTLIMIDKQGKVAKIHTGFSGPATGKYYDDFVKEFNQDVDNLLKKKKS
jgi:peroxiredoxin